MLILPLMLCAFTPGMLTDILGAHVNDTGPSCFFCFSFLADLYFRSYVPFKKSKNKK